MPASVLTGGNRTGRFAEAIVVIRPSFMHELRLPSSIDGMSRYAEKAGEAVSAEDAHARSSARVGPASSISLCEERNPCVHQPAAQPLKCVSRERRFKDCWIMKNQMTPVTLRETYEAS